MKISYEASRKCKTLDQFDEEEKKEKKKNDDTVQ